jgi:hypothetical protein
VRAGGLLGSLMVVACAPGFPAVPEDCRVAELTDRAFVGPPDRTDLLLVVDTHATTEDARDAMASRLGAIVRVMTSGDRDADGVREFHGIEDLIVTILAAEPGCGSATSITWRATDGEGLDPAALEPDVVTLVEALPACARSAPLEATVALLERSSAIVRDHAQLVVLVVTDEDEAGAAAHAARISALHALHGPPRALGLALVAGLASVVDPRDPDFDRARADGGCDEAPIAATAASALIDAAEQLRFRGASTALSSVCDASWIRALDPFVPEWPPWDPPCVCLPRAADASASVVCTMTEQLGASSYHHRCEELLGRDPVALDETDGVERCVVLESDGASPGFFVEPTLPDGACRFACDVGDIAVGWRGTRPERGAVLDLRCTSIGPSPGCEP